MGTSRSDRIAIVAALLVAAASGVASAEGPADKARADQLFSDGRRYLGTKEYAVACAAFEQSQALDPAIGTQLNIALCYEQWGHVAAAYRAYVEAERIARLKFDDRSKGARERVDALATVVPHLRIDLPDDADPGAVILLDGKELDRRALANDVLVEAGTHSIEARVPGQQPNTVSVDLKMAEHKRITIDAARARHVEVVAPGRSRMRLIGGVSLIGGGAVAIAVASALAVAARSDYQTAVNGHCTAGVCDQTGYTGTNDARSRANVMSFVAGGGLVLAAVGVYVLLSGPSVADKPGPAPGVTIAPTYGAGGFGLAIGGSL